MLELNPWAFAGFGLLVAGCAAFIFVMKSNKKARREIMEKMEEVGDKVNTEVQKVVK